MTGFVEVSQNEMMVVDGGGVTGLIIGATAGVIIAVSCGFPVIACVCIGGVLGYNLEEIL